jgi:hypothetical protein
MFDVKLKIFCIIIPLYFFAFGCLAVAAFLGAFATFGATGASVEGCAFSHCSGKLVFIIDATLPQEPKGLLASVNLIGASGAALYSAGDKILPFFAK